MRRHWAAICRHPTRPSRLKFRRWLWSKCSSTAGLACPWRWWVWCWARLSTNTPCTWLTSLPCLSPARCVFVQLAFSAWIIDETCAFRVWALKPLTPSTRRTCWNCWNRPTGRKWWLVGTTATLVSVAGCRAWISTLSRVLRHWVNEWWPWSSTRSRALKVRFQLFSSLLHFSHFWEITVNILCD